jgi:hypothetical protein
VALGAGFGLDLERCDPEVFEALHEILTDRAREKRQDDLMAELRQRTGG